MKSSILHKLGFAVFVLLLLGTAAHRVLAQADEKEENAVATREESNLPKASAAVVATNELKGITIGMTDDQVRAKLGKPQSSDATSMFYIFETGETVQLGLDGDKKVRVIAAVYSGKNAKAPDVKTIFGADAAIEPVADGKIYKRVRYPEAGYWVAYSQLKLDDGPMTTVTIQKIDAPK